MSRMFPFITTTWNPLGGRCPHRCIYCWSQSEKGLVIRLNMQKYQGEPRLIEKELNRRFKPGEFVFVQDMSDLFAENVPAALISKVLRKIKQFPKTTFLLQTKNPRRYIQFLLLNQIPRNAILGVTVETSTSTFNTPSKFTSYEEISSAPLPAFRLSWMHAISSSNLPHVNRRIFVSIEPVLDFDLEIFVACIKAIKPWAVAVGYDNYGHHLPEPPLEKTLRLIQELEKFTTVYRKTVRKAWWE